MVLRVVILIWAGGVVTGTPLAEPEVGDYAGDLRSSVSAIRVQAAVELGRRADASSVPVLTRALKDPEARVRWEAAKALGAIKDAQAVPALLQTLRDDDKNVRLYSAYALGEIKQVRAVEGLLQALHDAEWCVRDQAAWALREIREPAAATPLVAMLKDDRAETETVAWILRALEGEVVARSLAVLLQEPDAGTRRRAVRTLGRLNMDLVTDHLLAALKDSDAGVRLAAAEALAPSPERHAKRALKQWFEQESDTQVRTAVEPWLRQALLPEGLVGWWSFDDRDARTAKDVTGGGSDGEIRGATPADGKSGAALKFGRGRFVSLGKVPNLPIAGQPFTVMAWIKPQAPNGVVVARGGAFCGFSLYLKDGLAKFGIHREQNGPAYITAAQQPVGGDWTHLAGVVKPDAIELYVGGKLAAQAPTPGLIPNNCGQGMEIGIDLGNSPAEITDSFEGLIDEVKVFAVALPEAEIARHSVFE